MKATITLTEEEILHLCVKHCRDNFHTPDAGMKWVAKFDSYDHNVTLTLKPCVAKPIPASPVPSPTPDPQPVNQFGRVPPEFTAEEEDYSF